MAVRRIVYEEGTNTGYESVIISHEEGEKVFDSGNFVKDWYAATRWWILAGFNEHLIDSSCCDHFITDGNEYDDAYLIPVDLKPVLIYKYHDEGIHLFVLKGTQPTWKELTNMCDVNNI